MEHWKSIIFSVQITLILFCEVHLEQLNYFAKSEVIAVGEVEGVNRMAFFFGCRVGSCPATYLGLPLGAFHKSSAVWDLVEERFNRRLASWKKQYLSKGRRLTSSRALSQVF